jgi:hypothetical protein
MPVRSLFDVERHQFESVAIPVGLLFDAGPNPIHQLAEVCRFLFDAGRPGDDSWA